MTQPATPLRKANGAPVTDEPRDVPQHDNVAEVALLAAILTDPRHAAALSIARPDYFYSEPHKWLARAIEAVEPVNVTTVATRLRDADRLQTVGGTAYIWDILDRTPACSDADVASYAAIVRKKAQLRAGKAQGLALAAMCQTGSVSDVAKAFREATAIVEGASAPADPLTAIPDVVARIGSAGDRVPLGFEPLDRLSRGGVFRDFRIGIGGGPGAGKTTLCAQMARHMALAGWCVRWVSIDEGPEEILCRWLQQEGIPQDEAELLTSEDASLAAEALAGLDIQFVESPLLDTDMQWTQENDLRVVFIDSLQQVMITGAEMLEPRARVDAVLKFVKQEFSRNRILTVWTSELSRGAYRNQAAQDATDPIAASKESGAIEYFASILMVMRSVKDSPDLVEVVVPKVRRGGHKGEFCLRLDRERCTFVEVATDGNAAALAHDRALDDLATDVLMLLRARPEGMTVTALRGELRSRPGERGVMNTRLAAALARLQHAGAARSQSGPKRSTVWLAVARNSRDDQND